MSLTVDSVPITWPSLSDLANLLGVGLPTLSRLSAVRDVPKQRIGREVRVPPTSAIAILVARGLSAEAATLSVRRVVDRRAALVPALGPPDGSHRRAADARLTRSSVGSLRQARLTAVYRPHAGAARPVVDLAQYEELDRELGDVVVPVERYIHEGR